MNTEKAIELARKLACDWDATGAMMIAWTEGIPLCLQTRTVPLGQNVLNLEAHVQETNITLEGHLPDTIKQLRKPRVFVVGMKQRVARLIAKQVRAVIAEDNP